MCIVATLSENAGKTIAWMKTFGVKFDFLPTLFLTRSQPRLLPVGGGEAMVEALAAKAEELSVHFKYETAAQELICGEDGSVQGVVAKSPGKSAVRLQGSVVLACGGFEGNSEMMARYVGPRSVLAHSFTGAAELPASSIRSNVQRIEAKLESEMQGRIDKLLHAKIDVDKVVANTTEGVHARTLAICNVCRLGVGPPARSRATSRMEGSTTMVP